MKKKIAVSMLSLSMVAGAGTIVSANQETYTTKTPWITEKFFSVPSAPTQEEYQYQDNVESNTEQEIYSKHYNMKSRSSHSSQNISYNSNTKECCL
ncbi:hypothetical protein [Bacillus massiliigorillae]|uniref:hypothetical protein n=1 Tax=Bacillus massiliigorillae TaxID=1243664 RepID=UPI0003AA4819|nr:hypothetical protein [Bacillus massiliigorillae]